MTNYERFIGKKDAATKIRAEFGGNLPYDPFEIAEALGIDVDRQVSLEELSYSGFIKKHDNGSVSIWVNPLDGETRQHFTVAHEIGHLINGDLEHGKAKEFRDDSSTLYRSSERNKKEWAANKFAAELLMPEAEIKQAINRYLESRNKETAKFGDMAPVIAAEFGVSKSAMIVRFKTLGIIKD